MHDFDRIARIIRHLDQHQREQPSLGALAELADLSPAHLQRLFSRWAGVSPKAFLQCLTHEKVREALRAGNSVLDAAYEVGLSGPGRLHDLCVKLTAASPGEIKSGGAGWELRAGFAETPFGLCLLADGPRGVCQLTFVEQADRQQGEQLLRKEWPQSTFRWDASIAELADRIFSPEHRTSASPIRAYVRGTTFQIRVWQSLLKIPQGRLVSYGRLAQSLGQPRSARAVGTAVGRNNLAYLIPCHRVIRETGIVGNYRWGQERKRAILAWEAARIEAPSATDH